MKKNFKYLSIISFIVAISPLLLMLIDPVYHWLAMVTIPIGGGLGIVFLIIWIVLALKDRIKNRNEKGI